jgi:hypothetical protein
MNISKIIKKLEVKDSELGIIKLKLKPESIMMEKLIELDICLKNIMSLLLRLFQDKSMSSITLNIKVNLKMTK